MVGKRIRWGVIGPGKIAHPFVKDLLLSGEGIVTAVAGRTPERTKAFCELYAIEKMHTSPRALAESNDVDVVYIASPHSSHYEHALSCLNAGKAVLCEKPLTMKVDHTQSLIQASKKNQVFLMEALWSRFLPSIATALRLVHEGTIGDLLHIHADFGFSAPYNPSSRLYDPTLGGGCLLDIGIYPVFLAYALKGMPTNIRARSQKAANGVDDAIAIIMDFGNSCMATLEATFRTDTECRAQIAGSKGRLLLPGRWHEGTTLIEELNGQSPKTRHFPRKFHGFLHEIEETHRMLRNGGTESPYWTHDDSLNISKLLSTIHELAA